MPKDLSSPETFMARAPVTDDLVLAALPCLPYDRALDACKLLVEKWMNEMSYFRAGAKKQKWELLEPGYSFSTESKEPPKKVGEARWRLTLATATHHYYINVTPTYLGCGVCSRIYQPGESHTRGNDLPDGPFNRITWSKILTEMLAYELIEIPKEEPGEKIPDLWSFVDEAAGKDKSAWAVEHEKSRARGALLGAAKGDPEVAVPAEVVLDDPVVDGSAHLRR